MTKPEQQFFSAVINGVPRIGRVFLKETGNCFSFWDDHGLRSSYYFKTDEEISLQPLTLATANDTVIRGVTEPRMLRLLNLAVLHVPLDKYEDDWKLIGALAKQLNDKLITERDSQLSETPAGGERKHQEGCLRGPEINSQTLCGCPTPPAGMYPKNGETPAPVIQPATVSITLTEEEVAEFLSCDGGAVAVEIVAQVHEKLLTRRKLPMPEPKEGSVVRLFRKWGVAISDGEPDGGMNWKLTSDNEYHTWAEILAIDPKPEIIYSPRKVGGGK